MAPPAEPHPFPTAFILTVPLFHVTGLVPVMLSCFATGTKLVMMYKWSPERALELIERERVTQFVGVPTMTWDLLESPEFARRDTSSLLNVGGGGAPAPPELVTRVDKSFRARAPEHRLRHDRDQRLRPAELAATTTCASRAAPGRAVPILEMRVTDAEGRPLPPGEAGEIWFRGPNLIRGYWNKPEATARDDRRRLAPQRRHRPHRRRRASSPSRIAPRTWCCARARTCTAPRSRPRSTSTRTSTRPRSSACRTRASARRWRRRCCRSPASALDAESLRAHLAPRIAAFKIPTRIEIREAALPRNASGKILKRELRDALVSTRG